MSSSTALGVFVAVCALSVTANISTAQERSTLVLAQEAAADAQFDLALSHVARFLKKGGHTAKEVAEAYRLLGEASVAVGKLPEARAAFSTYLALRPDAVLDELVSPKIVEVFEAAKQGLAGKALQAHHEFDDVSHRLVLVVDSDPLSLVVGVRVSYARPSGGAAYVVGSVADGRGEILVPQEVSGLIHIGALDRYGNQVLEFSQNVVAAPTTSPQSSRSAFPSGLPAVKTETPLWTRWWLWGAGAGTVLTVGGVFAGLSQSSQNELDSVLAEPKNHTFAQAKALESKTRERARIANVAFGVTAGLGVVAAILYVRDGGRASKGAEVSLVPMEGRAIGVYGRF